MSLTTNFIYFPERELSGSPADIGLDYHDITFQAGDRKLHGWFLPHLKAKAAFLFFHGNAGNISHRLEKLKIFHEMGIQTFIIDYSGYGKSEGKPSEKNLYEDGLAAYEHTVEKLKIDPKDLILYGESLGCGVAIELARQKEVRGIILEGAFLSLKALAKNHMPFLAPLAKDQYNNVEKISSLNVPILFIHPKQDEICPFEEALQLFEKAPSKKQAVWLENGGHNDAFLVEAESYTKGIQHFLLGL